jgi:hypothetical protein
VTLSLEAIETRARDMFAWADGYEGVDESTARRCRSVARDALDLAQAYRDERQGREAMQRNYQRVLGLLTTRERQQEIEHAADATSGDNPFV